MFFIRYSKTAINNCFHSSERRPVRQKNAPHYSHTILGSIGKATKATFESAFNLALGIGLQNFPEGLAVSLPLAAFGHPKLKSFLYGQLSGKFVSIFCLQRALGDPSTFTPMFNHSLISKPLEISTKKVFQ